MSANLIVDLGNNCQAGVSIQDQPFLSGGSVMPASGAVVGQIVDMINANTFCNLGLAGVSASGQLRVAIQTSDSTVSGTFTDPTSGLAQLPTSFQSGGVLWLNSGGANGGLLNALASGQAMASGFQVFAGFQRPQRYVRAVVLSEGAAQFAGSLTASFVSQLKVPGSGGGFTYNPGSGFVNV